MLFVLLASIDYTHDILRIYGRVVAVCSAFGVVFPGPHALYIYSMVASAAYL